MSLQQKIIETVRLRGGAIRLDGTPNPESAEVLGDLHNAVEKLAKEIYSKKSHFIFELIQNAEDNDYASDAKPTLKFVLLPDDPTDTANSEGCLCVFNNETGFAENNVRAISKIGKSTKTDSGASGFIGEKGIGFKSVFQITSSPHIFSNGFQFKFIDHDPVSTLGYIVPYWIDETPEIIQFHDEYTTTLLLPLRRGSYNEVKDELEKFEAETILFLSKLHQLEVRTDDSHIHIKKQLNGQVCTLTTRENDDEFSAEFWIEKKTFNRPSEVEEEKRPESEHHEREISVAFPLTTVTGKEKVFAYLPTEEFPGLPFFINADFLLSSSRESILKENAWNQWLFEKTVEVAANGVIAMLGNPDIGSKAYRFVPLEKDIAAGHETFHSLVKSIQELISGVPCIRSENGELHRSVNSRLMPPKYRSIIGDDLPRFFDDLHLAERAANEFKARLKPLGLESVQQSDLEDIFDDREWVQNKDVEWCAMTLLFLRSEAESNRAKRKKVVFGGPQPYKMNLGKFAIVPATNGQKYRGAKLFMPLSDDHQKSLARIPSDLRDDLTTIDQEIIQALEKLEADREILTEEFEVQNFSLSNFISKTMLATLNDEDRKVSIEYLKRSIRFCIDCWDELEENGEVDILEDLPLLLENDDVVDPHAIEDREIVTPRTWDKETGWQLVFDDADHKVRYAVLSDFYQSIHSEQVEAYFEAINATEFPSPELVEYSSGTIGLASPSYAREVRKDFFNSNKFRTTWDNKNTKIVKTFKPPAILSNPKSLTKRNAFVRWLNHYIESQYDISLDEAKFRWFYYDLNSQQGKSEFRHVLISSSWVKTSQGLKPPGQVFVNDPNLRQWFKDKLAFLEDDFDDQIIDQLGIKKTATTEDLLDYLEELSNVGSTEPPKEIYKYLDEYSDEDLSEVFSEKPIIFTSENGGKWLSSKKVFWKDGSAALNDAFGWLENDYPNLRDFFVDKLGVKESIGVNAYADRWLSLQDTNDQLTVETFLNRGFTELRLGHEELEGIDFKEQCLLWSLDRDWQSPESIYINDSAPLFSLFKDDLYFVWTPKNITRSRLERFFDWLNVKPISSSVTFDISDDRDSKQSEENYYFNEHSTELIARLVSSDDREDRGDFEELIETGKLHALLTLIEFEIEHLSIDATVQDRSHQISDKSAFIDWRTNRAFICLNSDPDDVRDDLAEAVARHISGRQYKKMMPFLKDILTVRTKGRRQKLRNNYDWGFHGDHRKHFSNLKKEIEQSPTFKISAPLLNTSEIPDAPNYETAGNPEHVTNDLSSKEVAPTESIDPTDETNESGTSPSTASTSAETIPERSDDPNEPKSNSLGNGTIPNGKLHSPSAATARSGDPLSSPRYPSVSSGTNGSRVGKSRSAGRARTLNYAKRNRMISYVSPNDSRERDSQADAELASVRKKLGDRGEQIVVEHLRAKGYLAEKMPENNPGFDIEAIHPQTGELLYFEVKSLAGLWDGQGVTISQTQYDWARHYGESYFLAIVENLNNPPHSSPVYIQDPVSKINSYAFDVNWRKISTNVSSIIPPSGAESSVESLIAETDSDIGKEIIEFCEQTGLDLPEIGGDICNADGRVILDNIEMVWEEYTFGVYIADSMANDDFGKAANWAFLPDNDIKGVKSKLQEFLDIDIEDRTA